ncbi:MAG: hypothetical protein RIF33_24410 [Cyclobacteriaceae bacterium]
MKKIINTSLIGFMLCGFLSSCGVMFGGSKFVGYIEAKDHPEAEIYVDGQKKGKGSSSDIYARNRPLVVELRQDGCENQTTTYYQTFRTGNFILSVITWGLIGLGVDLGTGAAYKPDHRGYSDIERVNDRNYTIKVPYESCEVKG